jgi:hypothetical protein
MSSDAETETTRAVKRRDVFMVSVGMGAEFCEQDQSGRGTTWLVGVKKNKRKEQEAHAT